VGVIRFDDERDRNVAVLFAVNVIIMLAGALLDFFGAARQHVDMMGMLVCYVSLFLFLAHGRRVLGLGRLFVFLFIGAAVGFGFEFFGVRTGTVFGGHYTYNEEHYKNLMVLGMPIGVPVFWAVFEYIGYCITNSFLRWLRRDKPSRAAGNRRLIPLLVVLDGMIVMAFDMFMDPLVVRRGAWTWSVEGPFFGVPIGNFVGWFSLTVMSTTPFRLFEYFRPKPSPGDDDFVHLMPALGYGLMCVFFTVHAARIGMSALALTGFGVMMPFALVNVICFFNRKPRAVQ